MTNSHSDPVVAHCEVFRETLADSGLHAALVYLNGLTDYRFTGVYRFHGDTLQNVHLIDRHDASVRTAPDVPSSLSYCKLARDACTSFVTSDALQDERLLKHPARADVRSYCGVPLLDADGVCVGTLCHFDFAPRRPAEVDLELMLEVPRLLGAAGPLGP